MSATRRAYRGNIHAPDFPRHAQWLNTGGRPLSLVDLRGRFVLLDFWTYGCINCLHVIPDLQRLETLFPDELVVIGVHSAKFANERSLENVQRIVARYGIAHPVVNDPEMRIWSDYAVRAWPTTVLLDPRGRALAAHSGEGVYAAYADLLRRAVAEYEAQGMLDRRPLGFRAEHPAREKTGLTFPGKVLADESLGRLYIADSGAHRLVIADLQGRVLDVVGGGAPGLLDGPWERARFSRPQGLARDGRWLYVADTGNHALRRVDLEAQQVETVAGDGRIGRTYAEADDDALRLASPWDLERIGRRLYIAMAGSHQIWVLDLDHGEIGPYAGSGMEALHDGRLDRAAFAQPSGLAGDGQLLYVADSEASAVRCIDPEARTVRTLIGEGLFAFGDLDGAWPEARLQHPLGVAWHRNTLYVADTYNHKIKIVDPATSAVRTWLGDAAGHRDGDAAAFYEPGGLDGAKGRLYIADTNNHVIRVAETATGRVETLSLSDPQGLLQRRPADEEVSVRRLPQRRVRPGQGCIRLDLRLPYGYQLNAEAPSSLRFALEHDGDGDGASFQEVSLAGRALPIELPAHFPPGEAVLRGELALYYCREGEQGRCYMQHERIETPLRIGDDAPEDIVSLELEIVPPAA